MSELNLVTRIKPVSTINIDKGAPCGINTCIYRAFLARMKLDCTRISFILIIAINESKDTCTSSWIARIRCACIMIITYFVSSRAASIHTGVYDQLVNSNAQNTGHLLYTYHCLNNSKACRHKGQHHKNHECRHRCHYI